ncbi:ATP-binding protein [Pseudomonas brassicacearum]|uniref:ATP-binding protein n=1 Tax=Pseudomonas brassicacearum TaxID=930166 RepID=UPI0005B3CE11|nr:ATP-binding protein [Pseudomonas brassicacearum]
MTFLKPTLKISRLVVMQGGHHAFDCEFHLGVNVIRGRNTSGKTTVMDMLAYSLGAENIRWKPHALQCSSVMVEVALNGQPATLLREISSEVQRPISIFWGEINKALQAGPNLWERYPFKRSDQKISFSQALFVALDLPQAQGQGAANLTMHQLLRVLYADQPSVHSPIFRMDSFDSALTRETIGGYLCGVYNDELYTAQLRVREVNKSLDKKIAELRGIFRVLGRSGQTPDLDASRNVIEELEAKRIKLTEYVEELKTTRVLSKKDSNEAAKIADSLRGRLSAARRYESTLKDALAAVELDISDSRLFLQELNSRLQSLDESKITRQYLGDLPFQFCPGCLSEIKNDGAAHACQLCKSVIGEAGDTQLLRMRNELSIQIKESNALLGFKEEEAAKLRQDVPLATQEVRKLEKEYRSVSSSWSSDIETVLEKTGRSLGVLDEEVRQAHEKQKLFSVIQELQKQRDDLAKELSELEEMVVSLVAGQESRKVEVSKVLEKNMIRLLKLDLPLQPEFVGAHTVKYDFEENSVYVNGSRNFSESSTVVLRHIFHLALLSTSLQLGFMRVPRFMMLDGIDDGGMEQDRSHNLQKVIVEECGSYSSDYQLIFATSEIHPDIESSGMVVSRFFSPDSRSLDVR